MGAQRADCLHCGAPVWRPSAGAYCCFGCRFAARFKRSVESTDQTAHPTDPLVLRTGISLFLSVNIMVFSWFFYSKEVFGSSTFQQSPIAIALESLFSAIVLVLATLVVVLLGLPLIQESFLALVHSRRVDASTLIALSIGSAYLLSVINLLRGTGSVYFDTVAVVLSLVSLGHLIEARARERARDSSLSLVASLPRDVLVEDGGHVVTRPISAVAVGDIVRIRADEIVAVDGSLLSTRAEFDESTFTGESRPAVRCCGDRVLAGTIHRGAGARIAVETIGSGRAIEQVQRLLDRARRSEPQIRYLVDRVATWFVPTVCALALSVFSFHAWGGRFERGVLDALSVLLISCPCSFGLTVPLLTSMVIDRLARGGILVMDKRAIERASRARHVIFDKTGTLTEAHLDLQRIETFDVSEETVLGLIGRMELGHSHPLATAFLRVCRQRGVAIRATNTDQAHLVPGRGIEAQLDSDTFYAGSARWMSELGILPGQGMDPQQELEVLLASEQKLLARFHFSESVRPEAKPVVQALKELGLTAEILSGDHPDVVQALASELEIAGTGGLAPEQKVEQLKTARAARSAEIIMDGDGNNDAPTLKSADVGVSMGSAADLSHAAGNVRLARNDLRRVVDLVTQARRCMGRIRLSLAWTFGYNTVGLLLAAAGLLTPIFAATSMVVSGLVVLRIAHGSGDDSKVHARVTDMTAVRAARPDRRAA